MVLFYSQRQLNFRSVLVSNDSPSERRLNRSNSYSTAPLIKYCKLTMPFHQSFPYVKLRVSPIAILNPILDQSLMA